MKDLFDFFGSAVCHRMAERSFMWGDLQSPVCARCTGIEAGILFGVLFLWIAGRKNGNRPFSLSESLLAGLSFLPIAVDGVGSYLGFWQSNSFLRVVTGALAGYGLPALFLLAANFQPGGENLAPVYRNVKEQILLLAVSLAYGLLVWQGVLPYLPVAVISVFGIVCFYGSFVFLILHLIVQKRKIPVFILSALGSLLIIFIVGGIQR